MLHVIMIAHGKICPEPFVRNNDAWLKFKEEILMPEITQNQKEEKIKEFYGFDNNTIKYFEFYKYGTTDNGLIDKLYAKVKNG